MRNEKETKILALGGITGVFFLSISIWTGDSMFVFFGCLYGFLNLGILQIAKYVYNLGGEITLY